MNGWFDTDTRLLEQFRNRFGQLFSDFWKTSARISKETASVPSGSCLR